MPNATKPYAFRRWTLGVSCPKCDCHEVIKRGKDETQLHRQRYQCKGCSFHFDDLSNTIFAGHHQPLRAWILCLYFMGLNLSNQQIAQELNLDEHDVYQMTCLLREGIVARKPEVSLEGEVECDEVYITAGHKGQPDAVKKKDAQGDATVSKGFGVGELKRKKTNRFLG